MANEKRHKEQQRLEYIKDYEDNPSWDKLADAQEAIGQSVDERRNGEFITLEELEAEED